MDQDIREAFAMAYTKLDEIIDHQKEICKLKHDPIEDHLKDAKTFRDKIVKISVMQKILYTILFLILVGMLTGCASTGEVWERVDGKLVMVKYWETSGPQVTEFTKESFKTDSKQKSPLEGLLEIEKLEVEP